MSRTLSASAALGVYRLGTRTIKPLVPLILSRRLQRHKEEVRRIGERYGRTTAERLPSPLVWFHAASVGESLSILALIDRLLAASPRLQVLVTTGTVTSATLMGERLGERARHQYAPFDHPDFCAAFLDHWRPDLAIWVESEFWPNLMMATRARGIAMVLLNARMSPRSYRGWSRARGVFQALAGCFDLCLAQDETTAHRLRALGIGNVDVPGNLKLDAPPLVADAGELDRLQRQVAGRPAWLAASTHPGEEEIAGAVHRAVRENLQGLLTLIAPRHAARGSEVAAMLGQAGFSVARRAAGDEITPATDIYLADTMGEMGLLYRLAPLAFVGGSLVPHGGHNPIEPAQLGRAILVGPHMFNFAESTATLLATGGAREVLTGEALAREVAALLADPAALASHSSRARGTATQAVGVTDRVLAQLRPFLPAESTGSGKNTECPDA